MGVRQTKEIRQFIISNIEEHPSDIVAVTTEKFSISRPAVMLHIKKLVKENLLTVEGSTRDRKYSLKPSHELFEDFDLKGLEEDVVWREKIKPLIKDAPNEVVQICSYVFNEMLNNAIDHSEGSKVTVILKRTINKIKIWIIDDGVGIFLKIKESLGLNELHYAILELAKGKFASDPKRHLGQGIFFASRVLDHFYIFSDDLIFSHSSDLSSTEGSDWLFNAREKSKGTSISMEIKLQTTRTLKEVFDYYAGNDNYDFNKTKIPVYLAQHGEENLVSRSQAKRLLVRFDRFEEIILDFQDVDMIGQAFADEIFRVFQQEYPKINLSHINANEQVLKMILRAQNPT